MYLTMQSLALLNLVGGSQPQKKYRWLSANKLLHAYNEIFTPFMFCEATIVMTEAGTHCKAKPISNYIKLSGLNEAIINVLVYDARRW